MDQFSLTWFPVVCSLVVVGGVVIAHLSPLFPPGSFITRNVFTIDSTHGDL